MLILEVQELLFFITLLSVDFTSLLIAGIQIIDASTHLNNTVHLRLSEFLLSINLINEVLFAVFGLELLTHSKCHRAIFK